MVENNDKTRIDNSKRNIKFATIFQLSSGLLGFVERSFFIKCLSAEYLGLKGLITSILMVLSITEFGISSSLAFYLYAPLVEANKEKIKSLNHYIRKIYHRITYGVLLFGLAFLPFIPNVANTTHIAPYQIRIYFLIYLLGTVGSLLNSWHAIIIQADQKQYITTTIISVAQMLQLVVQVAILLLTRNFYLYALAYALSNTLRYVIARYKSFRMFPYLREKTIAPLPEKTVQDIGKSTRALIFHRMGFSITMTIECVLLSAMLGASTLGCFANYQLVILGLATGIAMMQKSIESSIGNLCTMESPEYCYQWFVKINHIYSLSIGYLAIILIACFNPFFHMVYPQAATFSTKTVFLISMTQYLLYKRLIATIYESSYGIFYQDRYKPVLQTVLSVLLSYIFGLYYKAAGIFLGIVISELLTSSWIEPYMVHKYGFHKSMKPYMIDFAKNFSMLMCTALATDWLLSKINLPALPYFCAAFGLCSLDYYIAMWIFFPANGREVTRWLLKRTGHKKKIKNLFTPDMD